MSARPCCGSGFSRDRESRLKPLLQAGVGGSERVLDPFDGFVAAIVGVNRYDIEAHNAIGEPCPFRDKQGGRPNDLPLLVDIDCQAGTRKPIAGTVAHFDKNETVLVEHDQVYFAKPAAEVSSDDCQALIVQVAIGESFCIEAYSSRVDSNHDSSSAASGNNNSGSSLVS